MASHVEPEDIPMYDLGMDLKPGLTSVRNNTGVDILVLTQAQLRTSPAHWPRRPTTT